MRELNATACAALYERVEWSGPWILATLTVLAIVNVMVVLGNVLVILAVYHTSKLRNVTNTFIVSLAVADLMVGLAVLPFSATWEVFKRPGFLLYTDAGHAVFLLENIQRGRLHDEGH